MNLEQENINQRQKDFYNSKKKNLPTRIWSFFRNGVLNRIKKDLGIEKEIYDLHKSWLGDLSGKKVLDLGCYSGNTLSFYLAQNAKEYLGIDLSEKGISNLEQRIKDFSGARAMAIDFLSEEFIDNNFDIIYAYGVLHHFKDVEGLIIKLKEKLRPGGSIISHDPLQTSTPLKIIRLIYRPFQSDKDWEWPFSKRTYYKFDNSFEIKERRAVLGKAKYAVFLNLLPFSASRKIDIAKEWHRQDWEKSGSSDDHMFRCMHLSLWMKKKDKFFLD